VEFTDKNGPEFDRTLCDLCSEMHCVTTCYSEGLIVSGKYYTVDELFRVFLRDQHYWSRRGGVTLTGGEPLLQRDFVMTLLNRMEESHFHVVVETTACLPEKHFMEAMQFVDWLFFDIKCFDTQRHKELTGVGNELILSNIRALACSDWRGFPVARITIVPAVNDDPDNIIATAGFVHDIGFEAVNILPFHRLGESKYHQLGRSYPYAGQNPPSSAHMLSIKNMIEATGLICYIGSDTPF
jgi:glycyl-radical enzyme activating protein